MINITEKQKIALENMENFIGIKKKGENFENYKSFQDYFELVKNKANKKANFNLAVKEGKIDKNEVIKKIKEKKEQYYNNESILTNYSINYINKYFPSKQQLKNQLNKKTKNQNLVDLVFSNVSKYIDENKILENITIPLLQNGKNLNYISNKLYKKKLDNTLVKNYLINLKNEGTLLKKDTLEKKILFYKNKGKSKYFIFNKLMERGQDKKIITETLNNIFGENGENENIKNEIQFFKEKKISNDLIIKKLLAKGFSYKNVKENLFN